MTSLASGSNIEFLHSSAGFAYNKLSLMHDYVMSLYLITVQ